MQGNPRLRILFLALLLATGLFYLYNIGVNDLWTENESFYGEAVREMAESGNYIDISYNYHPRFNKPPLTYWLMAASTRLFGMHEVAMRLPVVLLGFGAAVLTWAMARRLYGETTALLAFVMEVVSFQVVAGKHYASPEIPLLFFFTLTLWCFLEWDLTGRKRYMAATAVALGLTVLTKGYPYLILFAGIALFYLLLQSGASPSKFLRRAWSSNLLAALVLAGAMGAAWYGVMYLRNGDAYLEVLNRETLERALHEKSGSLLETLLFYPGVTMWSFFPYSTLLLAAIPFYISRPERLKEVKFAGAWLLVMLVMFTAAKGKIPTYFIQANPAFALLCSHFAMSWKPRNAATGLARDLIIWFPAIAGIILSGVVIELFDLPKAWYAVPVVTLAISLFPFIPAATGRLDDEERLLMRLLPPFLCVMGGYLVVMGGLMPAIEQKRPYDQITTAIERRSDIPRSLPIHLQDGDIKNLSYYARRRVILGGGMEEVAAGHTPVLVMVRSAGLPDSLRSRVFWSGEIYRRRSSESRLMLFIESYLKLNKVKEDEFVPYSILFIDRRGGS